MCPLVCLQIHPIAAEAALQLRLARGGTNSELAEQLERELRSRMKVSQRLLTGG